MAIKFVVDSGADIIASECKELGIIHLPLKVMFGSEEYEDSVNLSHREFYEKLVESDTLPTTSQVSPAAFEEAFRSIVGAGDVAIAVTISSKLSGTSAPARFTWWIPSLSAWGSAYWCSGLWPWRKRAFHLSKS